MTTSSSHDDAPLRLLLAARLSRKPRKDANGTPNPDQGIGIQTQDERAREWAQREGHVIVDVAADTRSGTVPPWDRKHLRPWVSCGCTWCRDMDEQRGIPERKRVYDHAKITQYDGVLAFKTDRLSRGDQEDFGLIEAWASRHGKCLVIVDGPRYPARDDSDYWSWQAEKRQAFKELENITERCGRSQGQIARNGAVIGKPPFGLAIEGEKYFKTLVPTEEGRRLVPETFDKVIAGESLARVAAWLTAQTGRTFTRKTVRDLIHCTTYLGERRNAAGVTVLRCEPVLVTPDGTPDWARFRAAQRLVSENPRLGPRVSDALLSGLLHCTGCGAKMFCHTVKTRTGLRYVYYRCDKQCGGLVRLDFAEQAVDAIITKTQDRPVTEIWLIPGNDFENEKQQVREALDQLPKLGLDRRAEQAERERLWAEQDRLEELEPVPATYDYVETGEGTYAQVWAGLDTEGRSDFLRRQRFRVYASKDSLRMERGEGKWTWRAYYDRRLGVIDDGDWQPED
jgi:DNA invertase Pin-like site-specific DNA recombinase